MRNHDFDRPQLIAQDRRKRKQNQESDEAIMGGFFWTGLNDRLRQSLVEHTRLSLAGARMDGRLALAEHDAAKLARREERLVSWLNATVDKYAYAMHVFQAWQQQRAKSLTQIEAYLKDRPEAHSSSNS